MHLFRPSKGYLAESTMATTSAPVRSTGTGAWSTIINGPQIALLGGPRTPQV